MFSTCNLNFKMSVAGSRGIQNYEKYIWQVFRVVVNPNKYLKISVLKFLAFQLYTSIP